MKIKKLNRKYCNISSLDELLEEQDRLEILMGIKEVEMKHDYAAWKADLSFSYLFDLVSSRFNFGPLVSGIVNGFSLFTSLFRKKKCRRK